MFQAAAAAIPAIASEVARKSGNMLDTICVTRRSSASAKLSVT